MNSKARVYLMLLVSLTAAGGFSTAQAQVMCGDTITTSEVLSADLSCSGFNPALTIQGPNGQLNMRHFTLSCEGSGDDGILMTGSGPRVRNGTVANCEAGVSLDGSRAQVSRMLLRDNAFSGLFLRSGSGHRISDTTAIGNAFGFDIVGNGNNFFNRNRATGNGFGFFGRDNDRYTRNVAIGNAQGFVARSGNTLSRNTSNQNGSHGFFVNDSNNTLSRNTSNQNGFDGFLVFSGINNTLTGNIARNNLGDGIDVGFRALNNTLSGNNASGNGSADPDGNGGFDLEDDSADCDNNAWTNNTGTRNQTCIQ